MWEYKVIHVMPGEDATILLNALGRAGWVAFAVETLPQSLGREVYFRRPLARVNPV